MPENEDPTPKEEEKGGEDKTFTQADVDRIVAERLQRERKNYADYDDLKAKAAKYDELEESQQTELEKVSGRLTEAEQRAQKAEEKALRLEVAQDKGLTPAQAKWLQGSSKEEFEQAADELLETFAPAEPEPKNEDEPTPRRPVEDLRPGATPSAGEPVNIREVVDSIPRGI